jgi:excisionase family DNA binding protein
MEAELIGTKLLTVKEVASVLHVGESTVYDWIRYGSIKVVTLPPRRKDQTRRSVRVPASEVSRILSTTK